MKLFGEIYGKVVYEWSGQMARYDAAGQIREMSVTSVITMRSGVFGAWWPEALWNADIGVLSGGSVLGMCSEQARCFPQGFDNFDPEKVSAYTEDKLEALRSNPGIIRNRLKIQAAVTNAWAFLEIQKEYGSFSDYIWHWTDGKVVCETGRTSSELSDRISKDLKNVVWSSWGQRSSMPIYRQ